MRFESVGDRMPKWKPAPGRGLWALSDPRLSNPSQDAKEIQLWSRKNLGQYSSPSLFPLIINMMRLQIVYFVNMYKQHLALNNLQ